MGDDPRAGFVAIAVILLLALVLRWVFRPSRPRTGGRPPDAAESDNLGLLSVILSGLTREDAMARRAVLGAVSIRSSMSRRRDGSYDVLVFHGDVHAAKVALGP